MLKYKLCCKSCCSSDLIRYGKVHAVQRYFCKACGRKFADNKALQRMSTPIQYVASAIHMFYSGMSLDAIGRHHERLYHIYHPSKSTVLRWINRFTQEAINKENEFNPQVSDRWVFDEKIIRVGKKRVWMSDVIDVGTRFLLASQLVRKPSTVDVLRLTEKAVQKAGKNPGVLFMANRASYSGEEELVFDDIRSQPVALRNSGSVDQTFRDVVETHANVVRRAKKLEMATLILEGWAIQYNFMTLDKASAVTPAEAAGVRLPLRSWLQIVANGSSQREAETVMCEDEKSGLFAGQLVWR